MVDTHLSFKRAKDDPLPAAGISVEIFTRFKHTKEEQEEMEIVLPATPAPSGIMDIDLAFGKSGKQPPVDLPITAFQFMSFGFALDPVK